jgi:hypothetical protein
MQIYYSSGRRRKPRDENFFGIATLAHIDEEEIPSPRKSKRGSNL